jgi:Rrf2 family protein
VSTLTKIFFRPPETDVSDRRKKLPAAGKKTLTRVQNVVSWYLNAIIAAATTLPQFSQPAFIRSDVLFVPNLLRISEAVSLGLHTMALLASRGEARCTNHEIADVLHASVHHLAKIMQRLARTGLVDSAVGPQGGFRLARSASDIRLLEIYEAIDGPLGEPECLLGEPICDGGECVLGGLVEKVSREVRSYLSETTLASLVDRVAFVWGAAETVDGLQETDRRTQR